MTNVLVVGSVALDTLETPHGRADDELGGSATHFALSASRFAPVRMVGVVGSDFPTEHLEMLKAQKIDLAGLERADGKTFRWHGRFEGDMARATTVSVDLGVFLTFQPKIPTAWASTPYVLLGNIAPGVQAAVLDQLKQPKFVLLDTMNLWIGTQRPAIVGLLPRVSAVCINFEEALQLADTTSGAKAVRKILDLGAKVLIMKRGEHGATLATRDGQFSVPSFPTDRVVDPTGAGDSFAGGLLGYLAQAGPAPDAMRRAMVYGSVMGSFAVEEFGTKRIQGVSREEVDSRAKSILEMLRV
ncbi:MAG TPA: PfkB family carbohydrate kinase [Planctomycetota bacterium]|nr:PfkB family carbohydrate kinase [Planctomycetota bacterium]